MSFPNYKCYPDNSLNYVFPSTNSQSIFAALDNIQRKIQQLDKERLEAISNLQKIDLQKNTTNEKAKSIKPNCRANIISKDISGFKKSLEDRKLKPDHEASNNNIFCSTIINSADSEKCSNNLDKSFNNLKQNKDVIKIDDPKSFNEFIDNNILKPREIFLKQHRNGVVYNDDNKLFFEKDGSLLKFEKNKDNLQINMSKLNKTIGLRINDKKSVLDGIYIRSMDNDTFVTLPEANQVVLNKLEAAEIKCTNLMKRFQEMNNSLNSKYIPEKIRNLTLHETIVPTSSTKSDGTNGVNNLSCNDHLVFLRAENDRLHLNQLLTEKKIKDLEEKIFVKDKSTKNTTKSSKCRNLLNSSVKTQISHSSTASSSSSDKDCDYKMAAIPFIIKNKHCCNKVIKNILNNSHTCGKNIKKIKGHNTSDSTSKYINNGDITNDECNKSSNKSNQCKDATNISSCRNDATECDKFNDILNNDVQNYNPDHENNEFNCDKKSKDRSKSGNNKIDRNTQYQDEAFRILNDNAVNEETNISGFTLPDNEDEAPNRANLEALSKLEVIIFDLERELTELFGLRDSVQDEYDSNLKNLDLNLANIAQQIELKILQIDIIRKHIITLGLINANTNNEMEKN